MKLILLIFGYYYNQREQVDWKKMLISPKYYSKKCWNNYILFFHNNFQFTN